MCGIPDANELSLTGIVVRHSARPLSESPCLLPLPQLVVLRDPNENSSDILRAHRSREKQYVFDHTFGPLSSQAEVYQGTGQGVVRKVMDGYNSTIFAYGATGEDRHYSTSAATLQLLLVVVTCTLVVDT